MSGEDDGGEKSFEATPQKLEEQRKKGEVPRSTDLMAAAAYGGLLLISLTFGMQSMTEMGNLGIHVLDRVNDLASLMMHSAPTPAGGLLTALTQATLPLLLAPALAVLIMAIIQRALVFTPSKLQPKLSRVSLISNAKNKFGRSGLFEFAKSCVKLTTITVILWVFLIWRLPEILMTQALSPSIGTSVLFDLMIDFLVLIVLIMLVFGAIDFFWQRAEHLRKNMMSHQEMRDEHKQSEGDPHAKQQRRQRGQEIAMRQMLADVPGADVVIVNPTHYAVALKWDRLSQAAPVCVAKGVDEIAARIRTKAEEAGVPIHADPPTARALHASLEIGQEIHEAQYQMVAAAIRFADAIRMKARARNGGAHP
ncbi:EscU/YscU/HrcU family type III secretion system export apparatus switch protein [Roseicitreum antarcticum]|uniref:Flagellar biosynthetic protein FlhB n=1 Tax=Roseicitreum antarcticum TaxID=564137 RepID=A0A1H2US90_9RHOB|nr:flagellar type III secretion system protein FlhB [Roseicitreum antarcticum]SDW58424.1 flagellar biosynthetic protein FlhB [Roseicitreum antarcticum]